MTTLATSILEHLVARRGKSIKDKDIIDEMNIGSEDFEVAIAVLLTDELIEKGRYGSGERRFKITNKGISTVAERKVADDVKSNHKEFTTGRQVLALHFIFEQLQVRSTEIDRSKKQSLLNFLLARTIRMFMMLWRIRSSLRINISDLMI